MLFDTKHGARRRPCRIPRPAHIKGDTMSLLDRATTPRRADATTDRSAPPAPLGGRYVTSRRLQPATEGTYVGRVATTRPTHRGTYVTTSTPAQVTGGRYTFSG